ncbi:MAG TPA: hypothetical protein VGH50_15735 [Candidatus Binatia bacterium]|jgi:hypothetical protein
MRAILGIAILLLVAASNTVHAADLPAQLRIDHSLRFRHHTITIDFVETQGLVRATVKTRHSQSDVVPEVDKTYTLTDGQAQRLRRLFSRLDLLDLRSPHDLGLAGTDGQYWILAYRNNAGELQSIKMWSPDLSADERGLTDYVALFKFALDAVGFDPETTMPKDQR